MTFAIGPKNTEYFPKRAINLKLTQDFSIITGDALQSDTPNSADFFENSMNSKEDNESEISYVPRKKTLNPTESEPSGRQNSTISRISRVSREVPPIPGMKKKMS